MSWSAVRSKQWRRDNPEKVMLNHAKKRSKLLNLPMNIELEDIVIPKRCPVLGITLSHNSHRDYKPTIDRIDNSKGYIKGNIVVISFRANRAKSNLDVYEIGQIYRYYKALL